jgi:hypothetical protein
MGVEIEREREIVLSIYKKKKKINRSEERSIIIIKTKEKIKKKLNEKYITITTIYAKLCGSLSLSLTLSLF